MGAAITMTSELVDAVQSSRTQVAGQGKTGAAAAERAKSGNGERACCRVLCRLAG